jgi:bla regulator protein blaR1
MTRTSRLILERSNRFVFIVVVTSPVIAGLLSLQVSRSYAQEKTPPVLPHFDVASIKPSNPDARLFLLPSPGGRLTGSGMTLKMLVQFAYQIQDFQVSGGPSWVNSKRYDINATGGGGSRDWNLRLQALLADRFKLSVHHDTKEMQIYAMKVAKGGPKLQKAPEDEPCISPPQGTCGGVAVSPLGFIGSERAPISRLAITLPMVLGRAVRDETGLKGIYKFEVKWTPESSPSIPAAPGDPQLAPATEGPSIFTAFEEQLGLKLESTRGPVDIVTIDQVEEPSPD